MNSIDVGVLELGTLGRGGVLYHVGTDRKLSAALLCDVVRCLYFCHVLYLFVPFSCRTLRVFTVRRRITQNHDNSYISFTSLDCVVFL